MSDAAFWRRLGHGQRLAFLLADINARASF